MAMRLDLAKAEASHGTARALFDYEAQDDTCVSLKEGDIIQLVEVDDGPWWKGTIRGVTGWFPASFVELQGTTVIPPTPSAKRNQNRPNSVKYRSNTFQTRNIEQRLGFQPEASVTIQHSPTVNEYITPRGGAVRRVTMDRQETQEVHNILTETAMDKNPSRSERFKFFMQREGYDLAFFFVYVMFNFIYFVVTYVEYSDRRTKDVLKEGLPLARGAGALLKINCAFIFFPVSRGLITWMRGSAILDKYLPLDSNLKLHKYIAYFIWICSTVHCFAHVFNFNKLASINKATFDDYFPDVHRYTSFASYLFLTVPGLTGVIIWIAQMLMYSSAMATVRHKSFEIFWYTHHLFVVFTVGILIHGSAAIFEPPGFWKWLIVPGTIYTIERFLRVIRAARGTRLHHVTGEASGVLAVYMVRDPRFVYMPGQYLFINCPKISKYEWHPFTITSCPEEKYLSIHIKAAGNWTKAFHKLFNPDGLLGDIIIDRFKDEAGKPLVRVDGPFGTPSEHVFSHRVTVLIGAGIGVTPYASILKSMFYKLLLMQTAPKEYFLELMRVEKVHFYWICRDRKAFEWFAFLLRDLEDRAKGFLEVHTYITEQFKLDDVQSYAQYVQEGDNDKLDPLTGLKTRTYFGRPNFDRIFSDMATIYPKENVGVFFCGPKVVSRNLRRATTNASSPETCLFTFRKENF